MLLGLMCAILLLPATQGYTSRDVAAVRFDLYTGNALSPTTSSMFLTDTTILAASSFDGSKYTYFLVHGWLGSNAGENWQRRMMRALLTKFDCNVFIIDWGRYARSGLNRAGGRTPIIGEVTADFIKLLETQESASRANMHLIGHSLGGQVVGFIGQNLPSPKVARITGMDSADDMPPFGDCSDPTLCLDATDGVFVDEIHTDVSDHRKGHADFWPILSPTADQTVNLHSVAYEYVISSIEAGSCAFAARKCASAALYEAGSCNSNEPNNMGIHAEKPAVGAVNDFYLIADKDDPCP